MTKEKTKWEISFNKIEENINNILPDDIKERISNINKETRTKIMNRTTYLAVILFGVKEGSEKYIKGIEIRSKQIINTVRESIKEKELVEADK